jgi:putative restriction endonuclease
VASGTIGAVSALAPFVANTDLGWFEFLAAEGDGRVDEVNFWSPKALTPLRRFTPGEPVFFRLKQPHYAVAGYGFFAHFSVESIDDAWRALDWKNGDPDWPTFIGRLAAYRGANVFDPELPAGKLGCTILRDARFWPSSRWIPWRETVGWHDNSVRGATVSDAADAARLLDAVATDAVSTEIARELSAPAFALVTDDERRRVERVGVVREGQAAFRARILDAYGRRCAITGERTEVVLDAAHIQSYLGPRSNHVQNGIALTQEFHTLFDQGLVGIDPELRVRVSPAIARRWSNGKRYYEYDRQPVRVLPEDEALRPSPAALEWKMRRLLA